MDKRSALKLVPGDRIEYGDSAWSAKTRDVRRAEVVFVTPKGGVRVRDLSLWRVGGYGAPVPLNGLNWIPYHHVIRKIGTQSQFQDLQKPLKD